MGCRSSQYITSISQYIPGISGKDVKISTWWNLAGFPAGQIKNIFKWPNRHGVSRALAVYCFFSLISLAESANFTLSFTDILWHTVWHIRKPLLISQIFLWRENLQETYDRAVPIPSPLRSCCDCCHSAFSCVGREFPSPKMHWSQWKQWMMLSQGFPATFLVIWCVQATLALGLSLLGCPSDAAQRSASQKRMERLFLNLRERGPGGPRRRPEEPSDEELYSWLSDADGRKFWNFGSDSWADRSDRLRHLPSSLTMRTGNFHHRTPTVPVDVEDTICYGRGEAVGHTKWSTLGVSTHQSLDERLEVGIPGCLLICWS